MIELNPDPTVNVSQTLVVQSFWGLVTFLFGFGPLLLFESFVFWFGVGPLCFIGRLVGPVLWATSHSLGGDFCHSLRPGLQRPPGGRQPGERTAQCLRGGGEESRASKRRWARRVEVPNQLITHPYGYGSKLNHQELDRRFWSMVHLGYLFLTHTHILQRGGAGYHKAEFGRTRRNYIVLFLIKPCAGGFPCVWPN